MQPKLTLFTATHSFSKLSMDSVGVGRYSGSGSCPGFWGITVVYLNQESVLTFCSWSPEVCTLLICPLQETFSSTGNDLQVLHYAHFRSPAHNPYSNLDWYIKIWKKTMFLKKQKIKTQSQPKMHITKPLQYTS